MSKIYDSKSKFDTKHATFDSLSRSKGNKNFMIMLGAISVKFVIKVRV